MTSENLLQLIKDDITKENTKMRNQSQLDYNLQPKLTLYEHRNHTRVMFMSIIFSSQL